MTEHAELEKTLKAQLEDLLARAREIEDDLRHELDDDLPEQAIDLADDEALTGIDDVLRQEISDIRQALLRIEDGSYGTCAKCGKAIRPERLNALPTATKCIDCA